MIACLRTVAVPAEKRDDYLAWIRDGRAIREARGILAELVLEPSSDDRDTVEYRPITRYDVAGGYLNLAGLTDHDPINPNREDSP